MSRVHSELGPNATQPTEPNKRTLTEQLVPIQMHGAAPDDATATGPPPTGGGGAPLPPEVRPQMEAALGGNFAGVRVHVSSYAAAIGARAFTRGSDLFFAPGAYDPTSPQGLELIGHELAHVVQQAQGRVRANDQIGGAPANTDASLEHEADVLGAKAASAPQPKKAGDTRPAHPPAPTTPAVPMAPADHGSAQMKAAPDADQGSPPTGPYLDELEASDNESLAVTTASGPPIQRQPKKKKREYVSFKIVVSREMTGEEFKTASNLQVFGVASVRSEWSNVKDHYGPADSPVGIAVEVTLLQRLRGAAAASKGIDVDDKGKIAGADAHAKGSAMHSRTPGDIDMEILVDQAEFDRLSKQFLENAPKGQEATLRASIAKKKIPSYEFYPNHDPSIASAAKKFTGVDGKPLDVQATLIVRGSEFDLGPFL